MCMEKESNLKLTIPRAIIFTGILLSSSFFGWYFLEKKEERIKQGKLKTCLQELEKDHKESSKKMMENYQQALSLSFWDRVNEDLKEKQEKCYKLYD